MDKLRLIAKNKFIRGGAVYTFASFIVHIFSYLFNSFSAKVLGPSLYGEITTLFSYLSILTVPFGAVSALIIRRLGRAGKVKKQFAVALEKWFFDKIKQWKYLFLLAIPVFIVLPRLTNLMWVSAMVLILMLVESVFGTFYSSTLQGLQLFFIFSAVGVGTSAISLLGPGAVLLGLDGIYTVYFFQLLAGLTTIVVGRKALTNIAKEKRKVKRLSELNKRIVHVLRDGKVIVSILSVLSVAILGNISVIYIKKFFPAEKVGIYAAWMLFARVIFYFSAPVSTMAYIFFSDKESSKEKKIFLLPITLLFTVLAGSVYLLYRYIGEWLLLFVFNAQYLNILSLMPKAALFGLFYTLIAVFNGFFVAKESNFALINVLALPFYLLLLYLFGGRSMLAVVEINIAYTVAVTAVYIIALFR